MKTMFTPTIRKTALAFAMASAAAFGFVGCRPSMSDMMDREGPLSEEAIQKNKEALWGPTPVEFAEDKVITAQKQYFRDSADFVRMAPDSNAYKKDYERLHQMVMAYYGLDNGADSTIAGVRAMNSADAYFLRELADSFDNASLRMNKSTGVVASESKRKLEEAKANLMEEIKAKIKAVYPDIEIDECKRLVSEAMHQYEERWHEYEEHWELMEKARKLDIIEQEKANKANKAEKERKLRVKQDFDNYKAEKKK